MALLRRLIKARQGRCDPSQTFRLLAALVLSAGLPCLTCAETTPEYQLKAIFVFHFAEFVQWPAQAFADAQTPLAICVLGEDPFDSYLEDAVRDEKVDDRSLVVRHYRQLDEVNGCHILFISRSERERIKKDLSELKGRSVLTVSDTDGFDRDGGMIGFTVADDKIQLRINLDATRAADLKLSSKLLDIAEIVHGSEK